MREGVLGVAAQHQGGAIAKRRKHLVDAAIKAWGEELGNAHAGRAVEAHGQVGMEGRHGAVGAHDSCTRNQQRLS